MLKTSLLVTFLLLAVFISALILIKEKEPPLVTAGGCLGQSLINCEQCGRQECFNIPTCQWLSGQCEINCSGAKTKADCEDNSACRWENNNCQLKL